MSTIFSYVKGGRNQGRRSVRKGRTGEQKWHESRTILKYTNVCFWCCSNKERTLHWAEPRRRIPVVSWIEATCQWSTHKITPRKSAAQTTAYHYILDEIKDLIGNCSRSSNASETAVFSVEWQGAVNHTLNGLGEGRIGSMRIIIVVVVLAVLFHGTIVRNHVKAL
jgi:hypothetical protein